ncbi:MAG TPA: lysylphosphatidylglycerol synthase domain-containing protein, partial [Candidatus Saccharimonadales bacterium]|nr:lysylphosphatidylglycerol synthase domain-containing protein [Candidatus Saccharimonadales bacterium]
MESEPHKIKRSKWRTALTALTFIALAALIYGVRKDIGGVIENIKQVNSLALLLIIPVEALNYDAYARMYVRFLKILGQNVRYRDMYRLNLELNFVNHILPSGGISGISYFTVRMRAYGVSGPKSTLSQLMKLLLLYASFQPLLIIGVFLLALRGHVNNLVMVVASSLITLLVVGTIGFIYMIESRSRIN